MSGDTSSLGLGLSAKPRYKTSITTSGSGTFTPQAGTTWLCVRRSGGGGAGGSTSLPTTPQPGGAAAPIVEDWVQHSAGATYSYAVGAKGVGVTSGIGGDGGDTTFGSLPAAPGGRGGSHWSYDGGSSPWGKGGQRAPGSGTAGAATNNGAGGGGNYNNGTGGDGAPGRLDILEF